MKYLPEGWRPWAHQTEFFEHFKDKREAGIFLEMGMGKTELSINLAAYKLDKGEIDFVVVFSLLSSIDLVWEAALARCKAPGRTINVTSKSGPAAQSKLLDVPAQWYLVNYEMATRHVDQLATKLRHGRGMIICDESTQIKNAMAQRSRALAKLGKLAAARAILTGTPTPQGPQDIFGQYLFLEPYLFGTSFMAFRAQFIRMGGYEGKQMLGLFPSQEAAYNTLIYRVAKRKTKLECMDLPPKVYEMRAFSLSKEEAIAYQQMAAEWVLEVKSGAIAASNGVVKSMRMAQICTGYVGTDDEEGVMAELGDSKLKALADLVEELDGKFIVWCRWLKNVRDVRKKLAAMGIESVQFDGTVDQEERNENVKRFLGDPAVRAFVGTGASGSMSLNLQSPEVKTVIYFSQGYSVMQRQQSEDRAWRGEIKHQVTVIDLVAKGTVEAAIVKALRAGKEMQEYLLQNPEKFIQGEMEV